MLWQGMGWLLPQASRQGAATLEHALAHGAASEHHHHDDFSVHVEDAGTATTHVHMDDGALAAVMPFESARLIPVRPLSPAALAAQGYRSTEPEGLFRPPRQG